MAIGLFADFGYLDPMTQQHVISQRRERFGRLAYMPIAVIIALVGIVGLAGWLANGDAIFLSLIQSGLAWCL